MSDRVTIGSVAAVDAIRSNLAGARAGLMPGKILVIEEVRRLISVAEGYADAIASRLLELEVELEDAADLNAALVYDLDAAKEDKTRAEERAIKAETRLEDLEWVINELRKASARSAVPRPGDEPDQPSADESGLGSLLGALEDGGLVTIEESVPGPGGDGREMNPAGTVIKDYYTTVRFPVTLPSVEWPKVKPKLYWGDRAVTW